MWLGRRPGDRPVGAGQVYAVARGRRARSTRADSGVWGWRLDEWQNEAKIFGMAKLRVFGVVNVLGGR